MASTDEFKPPTRAEAFETATHHAALLRVLHNNPDFKYVTPPTAAICHADTDKTPTALLMVTEFVESTYTEYVIPFLPGDATRKCREIANPWAYADPSYDWEWTWDAAASQFKDKSGAVVDAWPSIGEDEAIEMVGDIFSRGFMARKCVEDNSTDIKARMLIGGEAFDFGEEARQAVTKIGF